MKIVINLQIRCTFTSIQGSLLYDWTKIMHAQALNNKTMDGVLTFLHL